MESPIRTLKRLILLSLKNIFLSIKNKHGIEAVRLELDKLNNTKDEYSSDNSIEIFQEYFKRVFDGQFEYANKELIIDLLDDYIKKNKQLVLDYEIIENELSVMRSTQDPEQNIKIKEPAYIIALSLINSKTQSLSFLLLKYSLNADSPLIRNCLDGLFKLIPIKRKTCLDINSSKTYNPSDEQINSYINKINEDKEFETKERKTNIQCKSQNNLEDELPKKTKEIFALGEQCLKMGLEILISKIKNTTNDKNNSANDKINSTNDKINSNEDLIQLITNAFPETTKLPEIIEQSIKEMIDNANICIEKQILSQDVQKLVQELSLFLDLNNKENNKENNTESNEDLISKFKSSIELIQASISNVDIIKTRSNVQNCIIESIKRIIDEIMMKLTVSFQQPNTISSNTNKEDIKIDEVKVKDKVETKDENKVEIKEEIKHDVKDETKDEIKEETKVENITQLKNKTSMIIADLDEILAKYKKYTIKKY